MSLKCCGPRRTLNHYGIGTQIVCNFSNNPKVPHFFSPHYLYVNLNLINAQHDFQITNNFNALTKQSNISIHKKIYEFYSGKKKRWRSFFLLSCSILYLLFDFRIFYVCFKIFSLHYCQFRLNIVLLFKCTKFYTNALSFFNRVDYLFISLAQIQHEQQINLCSKHLHKSTKEFAI